ncbi:hypothetical protein H072_706 [Dactylellina haptotyla CBS 200.50]|uniref:Uncharacterized protein n=1 Tax=Dactylellina haptotyla (strain CBS 200.50) TaxID=1284197 RepID=S8C0P8_DACHA|nr:hypothetical protein H072_706 [Dactylellina haptotyla CBS 200.50]
METKASIEYRQSKRSSYSGQRPADPGERLLEILYRGIYETHQETECFFHEKGIRNKDGHRSTWNADVLMNQWSIFQQEDIRHRLLEAEKQYHFHAVNTSIVSRAIYAQTTREFPASIPAWSDNSVPAVSERLRDTRLLTRSRTARRPTARVYENSAAGPSMPQTLGINTSTYTETSLFEGPAISEGQLRSEANSAYTESQEWLFNKFEIELLSYPSDIENFELLNLLNKVVFWLSHCNPHWPMEIMAYTINYIQLMKAAWLLEKIMQNFPSEYVRSQFEESYLIEIQNRIVAYHPTTRDPPDLWCLKRQQGDTLLLRLTQLDDVVEQANPSHVDATGDRDIPRAPRSQPVTAPPAPGFPAFQKTVKFPPNDEKERLLRIFRCGADFSRGPMASEPSSDAIIIEEQISQIQRDSSTSHPVISRWEYNKQATVFSPIFYSLTNNAGNGSMGNVENDETLSVRHWGDSRSGNAQMRQFIFWEKTDAVDFQHALSGYRIRKVMTADSTKIYRRAAFGRKSSRDIRNPVAQIWVREQLQVIEQNSNGFFQPPVSPHNPPVPDRRSGPLRSGVMPDFPAVQEPTLSGTSGSGGSSASYISNISRTITCLRNPECSKLLIYGLSQEGKKQLIAISINEMIDIGSDMCCTSGKLSNRANGVACCPNVFITATNKTAEVMEFSEDSHNVLSGGYGASLTEGGRIAVPMEVLSWPSASKPVKFDSVLVRCRNNQDKLSFINSFDYYRGKYILDQKEFERDNVERRARHGHGG